MIVQMIADGVLTGSILSLGAIGITLGLSILRFANFAYAELLTVGAYASLAAVLALGGAGVPIDPFSVGLYMLVALILAAMVTAAIALLADAVAFAPLRRRGAGPLVLIFASFGLSLVIRNAVLLAFGPQPEYYTRELQIAIPLPGGIRIMPDEVLVLGAALIALGALWFFLHRTAAGLAMRAVAENAGLAQTCAMRPEAAIRTTWIVTGLLSALAGTLFGLTVQLRPEMGASLLLPLFTAAVLGGIGSIGGAVLGGLLIGVAQTTSSLVIPTEYGPMVPFAIMLGCFLLRPQGLFGRMS